jgi:hypothetical protein
MTIDLTLRLAIHQLKNGWQAAASIGFASPTYPQAGEDQEAGPTSPEKSPPVFEQMSILRAAVRCGYATATVPRPTGDIPCATS